MSRGTARSTMKTGRWRRARTVRSIVPLPMIGSELAVQDMMMSYSGKRSGRSRSSIDSALKRRASDSARSRVRFATSMPRGMAVANRTLDRAESLARRFNAESIELRDLPERLPEYDIIISCTASSLPIIGKGTMERTVRARRHRPVFMVDLAVPRDIEAEVAGMDDVFLYTIDDLAATVREGIDARQSSVAQAEAIIESQVGSFLHWMKTREMVPLIRQLRESAEEARCREVEIGRAHV